MWFEGVCVHLSCMFMTCWGWVCVWACVGVAIIAIVYSGPASVSCFDLLTVCLRHSFKGLTLFASSSNWWTGRLSSGSDCLHFSVSTLPLYPLSLTERCSVQLCSQATHLDKNCYIINRQVRAANNALFLLSIILPIIYLINWTKVFVLFIFACPTKAENTHILVVLLEVWQWINYQNHFPDDRLTAEQSAAQSIIAKTVKRK